MPPKTIKKALTDMLADLSKANFDSFCHQLVDRREEPTVRRNRVEGKSYLEIADVLVTTFTEAKAPEVAVELLREIGCPNDAEKLVKATCGQSSKPGPSDIVIQPGKDDEIQAVPTTVDKKTKLFSGPLNAGFYESFINTFARILEIIWPRLSADVKPTSTDLEGPSRSLEPEGCGNVMQDSSDWTELEPEVNSTDADEAPTYSLQSEAGNFECSVSGLRWVCMEKVSFKYQFCSLKRHMERIESMQYMPAGPLMDITVIAGKLDEVYLPHWICIDDNPTILDKFAVLHIDDCGDVVEKVSEVTSSHVKLSEPAFSLKMVLVKAGCSVEINSKVLIYGTKTPFFTLHVYLIPPDIGLLQDLEKTESSDGYRRFRKPHPKKPLKMNDWFILTAELGGAEIASDTLQLLYESTEPNFSEVFIEDPGTDLTLKLGKENESQPVWTCVIRQKEYQSTDGPIQGQHFVDRYRDELIERVDNIAPILDQLLSKKIIQQESYDEIRAIPTNQDKMRKLFSGPLNAAGYDGKEVFYKILEKKESSLIGDLTKSVW